MKGMAVRNRFRFIEKTKQISDYRGDRIDDGLVRVEFKFEKEKIEFPTIVYNDNNRYPSWDTIVGTGNVPQALYSCHVSSVNSVKGLSNDNGITVKGSETYQGFSIGRIDELETKSTVITLRLRGINRKTKKVIKKAVSVKTKITCNTCGRRSKSSAKFCRNCGTYIQ